MSVQRSGFGTFGKNESAPAKNKYNDEIEEISEDLESQHVKEIMGISEFGKKAKSFDIIVCATVGRFPNSISSNFVQILICFRILGTNRKGPGHSPETRRIGRQ